MAWLYFSQDLLNFFPKTSTKRLKSLTFVLEPSNVPRIHTSLVRCCAYVDKQSMVFGSDQNVLQLGQFSKVDEVSPSQRVFRFTLYYSILLYIIQINQKIV